MISELPARVAKIALEETACPSCGSNVCERIFEHADGLASYATVRCMGCGLLYLRPRPTSDAAGVYYAADSYSPFMSSGHGGGAFHLAYTSARRLSVRWKRRRIEKLHAVGSILDVGCGTGEFLLEMKRAGWRTFGLEPSEQASTFARRLLEDQVYTGPISERSLEVLSPEWDVITLWHVLEHLHEPLGALRLLQRRLKPDGLLLVAVPNVGSYDAGVYGPDWIALDPPRHLYHFTPTTMQSVLNQCGFRIVDRRQMPLDAFFNVFMSEIAVVGKRGWLSIPAAVCRAPWTIGRSLLMGARGGSGSSMLYAAEKAPA